MPETQRRQQLTPLARAAAPILVAAALIVPGPPATAMGPVPPELRGENKTKSQTAPGADPQRTRPRPQGRNEAEIRRMCTAKFDDDTSGISEIAGGQAGELAGPAMDRFRQCLIQNGVTP